MKTLTLLLSIYLSLMIGVEADLLLQPNDRVAICGDGMTADWGYSIYLEDYLLMDQPIAGLDVAQFGWSANDPVGFLARLNTDLLPFRPTVALLDFNSGDVKTRAEAQTNLVEALKKAGVRAIVLGSPVCVDSFNYQHDPAKGAAENQRLAALAKIDKDIATKEGIVYADVYGATISAMQKEKALRGEGFPFESDHDVFNMAVASAYLKALGCDGAIGPITFDYASGTAVGTPGQKIVSVKDGTIAIESTIHAFWFPGHNIAPTAPRPDPLLKCIPFNQDLDRYMLIAKNLPKGQIKVYWDDQDYDFSSDDLAKGINLPNVMPGGGGHPFGDPTGAVNYSVGGQHQQENVSGRALVQGKPDPQADAKREAALQAAKNRVVPIKYNIVIKPLVAPDPQPSCPIPVIVDTDMDSDIDDVAALALLNDFMDQGECNLLACLHDTTDGKDLSSCATIQAINAYYGHPSIPIGQAYAENDPSIHRTSILAPPPADGYHTVPGSGSSYTLKIHQRFDPTFPNDDKMPPAVDVYRKALAAADDGSVVICSIGNMQNVQDLLLSQPDSVSNLSGADLVRKKVREVVIMFNTTPKDRYLLSQWPVKVVWSIDIGNYISLGKSLVNTPENNPVRVIFNGNTRQGWDPTAAWLSVRGTGDVYDLLAGRPSFLNEVTHSPPGPYLNETTATVKMPAYQVLKLYEDEMARPPKY